MGGRDWPYRRRPYEGDWELHHASENASPARPFKRGEGPVGLTGWRQPASAAQQCLYSVSGDQSKGRSALRHLSSSGRLPP